MLADSGDAGDAGLAGDGAYADLRTAALIAEAQASQTLVGAADVNLQVLDGVGFTWRDPAHWFVRRARTTSALLGTAEKNHALLAEQIGL